MAEEKAKKETNSGMRKAVDFLAKSYANDPKYISASDLLGTDAVQAVAVALGRDPMEIAFKTAQKIREL